MRCRQSKRKPQPRGWVALYRSGLFIAPDPRVRSVYACTPSGQAPCPCMGILIQSGHYEPTVIDELSALSNGRWGVIKAMLTTRLFDPADGDILYHYCPVSAFHAILESGKVRFTDINMLNDQDEMRWGYRVFEEAATNLLRIAHTKSNLENLNKSFFDKVDEIIAPLQSTFHPFVACFSLESDNLGQWRAYADDASGVAIGFDAKALKHMPVSLLAVEYDRERQVQEMMDALGACYLENESDGRRFDKKFFESCAIIGCYMAALKNPSFKEEKEVRSLHVVNVEMNEELMRLHDRGGRLGGSSEAVGDEIRFHVRNHALLAYLDIPFRRGFEKSTIKRIMLGPRNPNPPGNILYFAGSLGYGKIAVVKSTSSYR
jgi:hypothetical protein